MKILTFKEFKKDYRHDLLNEISVLKSVKYKTFTSSITEKAEIALNNLMNNKRVKSERELTKKIEYINYLDNHLLPDVRNFDRLYKLMKEKEIIIDDLRAINSNIRKTII